MLRRENDTLRFGTAHVRLNLGVEHRHIKTKAAAPGKEPPASAGSMPDEENFKGATVRGCAASGLNLTNRITGRANRETSRQHLREIAMIRRHVLAFAFAVTAFATPQDRPWPTSSL
jgi:hypothetical protein